MKINFKKLPPIEVIIGFPIILFCAGMVEYYIQKADYDTAYIYDTIGTVVGGLIGARVLYKVGGYLYKGFKYKQW